MEFLGYLLSKCKLYALLRFVCYNSLLNRFTGDLNGRIYKDKDRGIKSS